MAESVIQILGEEVWIDDKFSNKITNEFVALKTAFFLLDKTHPYSTHVESTLDGEFQNVYFFMESEDKEDMHICLTLDNFSTIKDIEIFVEGKFYFLRKNNFEEGMAQLRGQL